jgi:diguanylate cyclase (GGDEF)-like protein/PAS domain S-box-containing protein
MDQRVSKKNNIALESSELLKKQLEILLQATPITVFTHLFIGMIWIFILWGKTDSGPVLIWYCSIFSIMFYRFALYKYFQRIQSSITNYEKWYRFYLAGIFITGIAWGLSGSLTPELNKELYQIICALIICIILTGGVTTLYASKEASFVYMTPTIIPHLYYLHQLDSNIDNVLISSIVICLVLLIFTLSKMNKTFINRLELEVENEKLILELKNDKEKITSINAELEHDAATKEDKYIKAFKASPDPISITRLSDGMFIEVNQRLAEFSGYAVDEIVGKTSFEINLWADINEREVLFKKLHENNGSVSNFEVDFVKKDGEIRNCLLSAEVIDINNESHILSVTKDITKFRLLRNQLIESEDKFHKAFKTSPNAITITRLEDGLILDANQKWADMTGYSLDELIGHFSSELKLWGNPKDREKIISKIKKGEHVIDFEAELRTKHDEIRSISLSVEAIDLNNENCLLFSTEDITETKILQENLRASEEKFFKAFWSFPDPMTISTLDGILVEVNESCIETSGFPRNELIGQSIFDIGAWSDLSQREIIMQRLKEHGYARNIEADFVKKDGEITHSIISASIIQLNDIPHMLLVTRDISEQKNAQQQLLESEERFKNAFAMAPIGIALVDKTGTIFHTNPRSIDVIGYKPSELVGKTIKDLTHPDDLEKGMVYFSKLMRNEIDNYQMEKRYLHKKGHYVYCKISASSLKKNDGEILYAIVHVEDISEQKENEAEINKLLLSIEHSPNVVMITNNDAVLEYVNPKFTEVTGYTSEEVLGKKPSILAAEENSSSIYRQLWDTISIGKEWRGEFLNRKKNGDIYWASQIIFPIKNKNNEITHYVSLHEDITEARKITEQLSYQASHDMLTGLINRSEFEKRLERVINTAKNEESENVLCFLDLDQFKLINDACGHMAGDEFLHRLGDVLKNTTRHRDVIARLGGDEFAVLMEHCPLEQGIKIAEQIRTEIEEFQFLWEKKYFSVGVSIGLTVINNESQNLIELLKQADTACYTAKDMGRNRIHVYRENDLALATRKGEMNWAQKLNDALTEDQFMLYAQEIVPVSSSADKIKSYEILLRLDNPDGEPISPTEFIVAADRYNLNVKIDRWVIANFMSWLIKNQDYFKINSTQFSINLSGASINDKEIKTLIIEYLDSSFFDPQKITFEITETAAIANFVKANEFMSDLSRYGCKFSLDDFGSGLSSFAYLKNLPTDTLKIDGMFVKDIDHNKNDYAMVRIINEIGHTMGMKTVAEFVENEAIMKKLKEIGVNYAQGYWTGKVLPIDSIINNS